MPIRHSNVFDDLPGRLNRDVNPYVGELIAAQGDGALAALYGPHLAGLRGKWRQTFVDKGGLATPPAQLVLEIGVHKGRCLTAMAANHPQVGFIGLDITFKRVVVSARKCRQAKLGNAICALADARHAGELFAPGELNGVVAFFPDPWTKKASQAHNRLFSAEFCRLLAQLMAPGSFFWLKTDASTYFRDTALHLEAAGFKPLTSDKIASARPLYEETYESCFEAAFKSKQVVTYEGVWTT